MNWEIQAVLKQDMGLLALQLPSLVQAQGATAVSVPVSLYDNIQSGYAVCTKWDTATASTAALSALLETALLRSKKLIDNSRAKLDRNL